jgi:hypothetical protein
MCSLEIPRLRLVANKRCGVAFAANMKDCRSSGLNSHSGLFRLFFFLQALAAMEVTNGRSMNPNQIQPFRHSSQLVGNVAFHRGRFVGKKVTGLFARVF